MNVLKGLTIDGKTATSLVASGTLAACRAAAVALGMGAERLEGRILSFDSAGAIYAPVDETRPNRIVYAGGGMVQRCRDDYAIVIPAAKLEGVAL
jgi:hypothetical protein